MNVLIGCEYSGIVRDAFTKKGHYAVSCDLLPTETRGLHYQGDIFDLINSQKWDLIIAFPPCTYLCRAQSHLLSDEERFKKHLEAIEFVKKIWASNCDKICIENPIGFLSTKFMKPSQITSFNFFGDPYKKDICLWLKNLPHLQPTNIIEATKKVSNHVNSRMTKEEKNKIKSKFFKGIAEAMAEQWSDIPQFKIKTSPDLSTVLSPDPSPALSLNHKLKIA
jgi:site-specific DNA-cytosine methylase